LDRAESFIIAQSGGGRKRTEYSAANGLFGWVEFTPDGVSVRLKLHFPPLPRWATLFRPSGTLLKTGLSAGSEYWNDLSTER